MIRHLLTLTAILLLFVSIPAAAADKWTRVQSKNFVLVGSAAEREIRDVAENLEVFRTAFSRFFAQAKDGSSVATTVVVFKSDQAFKPFKPVYQGKPANIAGYFQGGADLNFIALSADMQTPRVIYHEYVHRLMSDNLSALPPWFQEGFAECFSTLEIEGKDKKVRLGRAIGGHVELLNQRRFMPLEQLFAVVHGSPEYNEEEKQGLFYAESWALVHYMMFNAPERRAQFFKFLDALSGGRPATEAFQEVFKTDLASFQKMFEAYIHQRMAWNAFELQTPGGLDRSKDMTARTMSEAEAEFYLGDLLLHSYRLPEAETHLTKAVQLDPKLGAAQAAMGRLLMRKDNDVDALVYLQRATQLEPNNYLVHYYYASALRGQGTSLTESQWATLRSELQNAIQLAPHFVEATEMLANANLTRNVDMPLTVDLLVKAIKVAPGRDNLYLQLAYALSRTEQRESARPLVRNLLAKATLEAPLRQGAQSLVEYLDRVAAADIANREIAERMRRGLPSTAPPGAPSTVEVRADRTDSAPAEFRRTPQPELERFEPAAPMRRDDEALAPGTARIRGVLTLLDCTGGLTISLNVDGKIVKLHSPSPGGIKFTSFNAAVARQISCGPAPENGVPAQIVYRPIPGEILGEPLAVDFIEASGADSRLAPLPKIPGTLTAKGLLTNLDCSGSVTLSVVSEGMTLQFRSDSASKVAFLNGPNPDGTVNCGPVASPGLPVVVLYRPAALGNSAGEPLVVQFQR